MIPKKIMLNINKLLYLLQTPKLTLFAYSFLIYNKKFMSNKCTIDCLISLIYERILRLTIILNYNPEFLDVFFYINKVLFIRFFNLNVFDFKFLQLLNVNVNVNVNMNMVNIVLILFK